MDRLLELVDALRKKLGLGIRHTRIRNNPQLLKVAVGDVMTAPVRNSIELDAMRELHVVLFFEPLFLHLPLDRPLNFFLRPGISFSFSRGNGGCRWYGRLGVLFKLDSVWAMASPSKFAMTPPSVVWLRQDGPVSGNSVTKRGGIREWV
jgi:hypothetical protein